MLSGTGFRAGISGVGAEGASFSSGFGKAGSVLSMGDGGSTLLSSRLTASDLSSQTVSRTISTDCVSRVLSFPSSGRSAELFDHRAKSDGRGEFNSGAGLSTSPGGGLGTSLASWYFLRFSAAHVVQDETYAPALLGPSETVGDAGVANTRQHCDVYPMVSWTYK